MKRKAKKAPFVKLLHAHCLQPEPIPWTSSYHVTTRGPDREIVYSGDEASIRQWIKTSRDRRSL